MNQSEEEMRKLRLGDSVRAGKRQGKISKIFGDGFVEVKSSDNTAVMTHQDRLEIISMDETINETILRKVGGRDDLDKTDWAYWKQMLPDFLTALFEKAEHGRREYGEKSWDRPVSELIEERMEERLDDIIWGIIEWSRLGEWKDECEELEQRVCRIKNGKE